MEDGSQNGHHTEETPDEHRTGHLQNILDEVLTVLVEETADDDEVEEAIEDVLIALVEVVGARVQRLPRPLIDALSAWVGTDARAYLRTVFADDVGRIGDQTPDAIARYLAQTDEQYWPEE